MVHDVRFQNGGLPMIFVAWVGWDHGMVNPVKQGPASFHGEATEEWSDEQQAGADFFFAGPLQDLQVPLKRLNGLKMLNQGDGASHDSKEGSQRHVT